MKWSDQHEEIEEEANAAKQKNKLAAVEERRGKTINREYVVRSIIIIIRGACPATVELYNEVQKKKE